MEVIDEEGPIGKYVLEYGTIPTETKSPEMVKSVNRNFYLLCILLFACHPNLYNLFYASLCCIALWYGYALVKRLFSLYKEYKARNVSAAYFKETKSFLNVVFTAIRCIQDIQLLSHGYQIDYNSNRPISKDKKHQLMCSTIRRETRDACLELLEMFDLRTKEQFGLTLPDLKKLLQRCRIAAETKVESLLECHTSFDTLSANTKCIIGLRMKLEKVMKRDGLVRRMNIKSKDRVSMFTFENSTQVGSNLIDLCYLLQQHAYLIKEDHAKREMHASKLLLEIIPSIVKQVRAYLPQPPITSTPLKPPKKSLFNVCEWEAQDTMEAINENIENVRFGCPELDNCFVLPQKNDLLKELKSVLDCREVEYESDLAEETIVNEHSNYFMDMKDSLLGELALKLK